MGLFSFIKEAGSKVLGFGKNITEEASEKNEKRAQEEQDKNERVARKLEHTIHDLDLKIDELSIHIEDDMAVVSGKAGDQANREKIILAVGNTEGISQVDDRMDVEDGEPEAVFHTVETGDDLEKIAGKHYGDPAKYKLIFEANKPMLKDPKKIYPGQVLRIPPEE
ncbi:peptidoglycan-binding protein LysM [Salegentibacter chungangensis]|uniref:Peptidoglycan-binding protein LysM n=1 Tax=Salegentibacter chungangensis TaxID=1335724 RepID=A0ABW3NPH7_9FLAO